MPRFAEWVPGDKIQVLVFGKFKTGKTYGALTFPRPNIFSFDEGLAVGANPEFTSRFGRRDFMYEEFREKNVNKQGIPIAHNAFDDACRYFDACMKSTTTEWTSPLTGKKMQVNSDMFDTWVIDSATTLFERARTKAIILLGGNQLAMASKTQEQAMSTGLIYLKQQDYGSQRSLVEQFVDMIKSSGKHVVLLAHEYEATSDSGAVTDIVPLFVGGSKEAIPVKFDEVYRLTAKKFGPGIQRGLMTHTDGISRVGTRYGIPDGTEWSYDALNKFLVGQAEGSGAPAAERT